MAGHPFTEGVRLLVVTPQKNKQSSSLWVLIIKGWCDEFETGLNIIKAIVQKA